MNGRYSFWRQWLNALNDDLSLARQRARQPDLAAIAWLFGVILCLSSVSLALLIQGGYHAGFLAMNNLGSLLPGSAWETITYFGDARIALALSLPLLRRHPETLWIIVIAALIGSLMAYIPKIYLVASRPADVFDPGTINIVGTRLRLGSFPSGHSLTAFVLAGTWISITRNNGVRALLVLAATVIAASRVFIGAHWPIDCLVGAAGGTFAALLGVLCIRRFNRPIEKRNYFLALLILPLTAALLLLLDPAGAPVSDHTAPVIAIMVLGLTWYTFFYRYLGLRTTRASE